MPSPKLMVELVQQVCGAGARISERLTGGITITTGTGGTIVAAERQVLGVLGDAETVAMAVRLDERLQGAASYDPTSKELQAREEGNPSRARSGQGSCGEAWP